jgi:hypothetical protein
VVARQQDEAGIWANIGANHSIMRRKKRKEMFPEAERLGRRNSTVSGR